MSSPSKPQKKYCLNCFHVMQADEMLCKHCQYLQPSTYNPTYIRPPYRIQQYILGRVLGHGGFAITYLAYDRSLGTRVAIKPFPPWGHHPIPVIVPDFGGGDDLPENIASIL